MVAANNAKDCINVGYSLPKYLAKSPKGTNEGMFSGKRAEENVNKSPYGIKRTING